MVAQLVERLPSMLENRGLNPVIGNIYLLYTYCIEKTKIKKKLQSHSKKIFRIIYNIVAVVFYYSYIVPMQGTFPVRLDCSNGV